MGRIGLAVVLAICLSLTIATGAHSAEAGDDRELRTRGGSVAVLKLQAIKDFSYPEVNAARPVSIREFDGKVVVVNLWAT